MYDETKYQRALKSLKRLEKEYERREEGSNNREKTKLKIASKKRKIANMFSQSLRHE